MEKGSLDFFFEATPDLMAFVEQGRFVEANGRWRDALGYAPEALVGRSVAEFLPPGALEGPTVRFRAADGAPHDLEWRTLSQGDRLLVVARDVTERRAAQKALQTSEALLRESQRVAGIGHYDFDIAAGAWTSSEGMDLVFGIAPKPVKDFADWLLLIHPDWRERMLAYFRDDVLARRQPFDATYLIVRPSDGVERWVHGLGTVEFDGATPLRMFGVIQDVTERRAHEDEVRRLNNEQLAVVGQLTAGMAHELNTPLGALVSAEATLRHRLADDLPCVAATLGSLDETETALFLRTWQQWRDAPEPFWEQPSDRRLARAWRARLQGRGVADLDAVVEALVEMGWSLPPEGYPELLDAPRAALLLRALAPLVALARAGQVVRYACSQALAAMDDLRSTLPAELDKLLQPHPKDRQPVSARPPATP